MNRAQQELNRMSAEAWRELARDVRGAGKSAGRLGFAYMKKHPVLTLGGGAVLAGLALWRMRRPALVVKERSRFIGKLGGFARSLLRKGSVGLARALLSFAIKPSEGRPA